MRDNTGYSGIDNLPVQAENTIEMSRAAHTTEVIGSPVVGLPPGRDSHATQAVEMTSSMHRHAKKFVRAHAHLGGAIWRRIPSTYRRHRQYSRPGVGEQVASTCLPHRRVFTRQPTHSGHERELVLQNRKYSARRGVRQR
jgi:hypothetical protein